MYTHPAVPSASYPLHPKLPGHTLVSGLGFSSIFHVSCQSSPPTIGSPVAFTLGMCSSLSSPLDLQCWVQEATGRRQASEKPPEQPGQLSVPLKPASSKSESPERLRDRCGRAGTHLIAARGLSRLEPHSLLQPHRVNAQISALCSVQLMNVACKTR